MVNIYDSTSITSGRQHAPLRTIIKTRESSYSAVSDILASAQAVTSAWADLGTIVDMEDYDEVIVYAEISINDSEDIRFRAVAQIEESPSTDFTFITETITGDKILGNPEYIELAKDQDDNIVLKIATHGIRYIQLQVQAGTVGATAGDIDKLFTQRRIS
jgi:hypothetical protein